MGHTPIYDPIYGYLVSHYDDYCNPVEFGYPFSNKPVFDKIVALFDEAYWVGLTPIANGTHKQGWLLPKLK